MRQKYLIFLISLIAATAVFFGARTVVRECRSIVASVHLQKSYLDERLNRMDASLSTLSTRISDESQQIKKHLRQNQIAWNPDLRGTAVPIAVDHGEDGPITPVSMTQIGQGQFLFVNYRNVYFLDENKRTAKRLLLDKLVPRWNPTAVFYSAFYDYVFIANYTGADILVTQLVHDGDDVSLKLIERITDKENIKGPEGVEISRGGRFMALADYEGNEVSLFERVDSVWRFRWKQPLTAAHAITIIGNRVFAGGTSIVKYDIETGKELARTTTIGKQPVLFATCLSEDRETGDLIGSDTMMGRVFLLTDDLRLKSSFGANGPGYANLSMPYCAYRYDSSAAYVLSTYQARIIKIVGDKSTSFDLDEPGWAYAFTARNANPMWHGVTKFDSPLFHMFGKKVLPSYGSLRTTDGTTFLLPPAADDKSWPSYVTTIAEQDDWLVIVANSSPVAMVYNRKSGALGSVSLEEWDCWADADEVLCPSGKQIPKDLAAKTAMLSTDPAPKDAKKYLTDAVGKAIPIVDYWRAWRSLRPQ